MIQMAGTPTPRGFVRDSMDVRLVILYVLRRVDAPLDFGTLVELCLQDDGVNYMNLAEMTEKLRQTGHLTKNEEGEISITRLGNDTSAEIEDSLAAILRKKLREAVDEWKRLQKRKEQFRTDIKEQPDGTFWVDLTLNSPMGEMMRLAIPTYSDNRAEMVKEAFFLHGDTLYSAVMEVIREYERERLDEYRRWTDAEEFE